MVSFIRLLIGIGMVAFFNTAMAEWNETPDYWKCNNRVSGDWTFGIAPYGCDANAFGSDQHIIRNYQPVLFMQSRDYATERNRYMQETYSMIKEVAAYYIQSRKPNVSRSELTAFQHAALAVAHQESYWSHYRKARQDGRYKMMRGDFGHGHGLMQVDDRAHYTATRQGKGWELITNMLYSLDEYYTAWRGANFKWCIQRYGNTWRNRSREAYSQYNGGPRASCRWTNPNHRWARNDKGFAQKYDRKLWENFVADRNQSSKINVPCLANGGANCPPDGDINTDEWYNKLLQTHDNAACVFDGQRLHCVADMRHSACLVSVGSFNSSTIIRLNEGDTNGISRRLYNPHKLCFDNVAGLSPVGSFIELKKENNLRATPNGELVEHLERGQRFQVLDIVVFDNSELKRFYKVLYKNQEGYIWGGTKQDYKTWTQATIDSPTQYSIPVINDWVSIAINRLNFRATPGGEKVGVLDRDTIVLVKGLVTQDSNNQLYLHITHEGQEGYIYAGYLLPQPTLENWVSKINSDSSQQAAYCPEDTKYDGALMVCRNETDTYGPFTERMHEKCNEWGGGAACNSQFTTEINGEAVQLSRWSTEWFLAIRENSDCPLGAFRSKDFGWHCVEKNSRGEVTEVYGPFDTSMVQRCISSGGGKACYFNRWSAAGFQYWRHPQ
ncbi:SH3 domain-containing protein [Pleionea sediminis]|uniref:SH3 domain-containing protein n=1 Tax=Pleionea sediminis TaxID=2569479 RepID=UPI0011854275|nr:SH3 domain-containing protein [Pleionea sediminis]